MIAREIRDSFQVWKDENNNSTHENLEVGVMIERVFLKLERYDEIIKTYENLPIKTSI
jgi:hypothetical protein